MTHKKTNSKAAAYNATQRTVPTSVDGYTVETSSNKSGYVGVTRSLCGSRWKATLGDIQLGQYIQKADAVAARTRAKIKKEANKKLVDS